MYTSIFVIAAVVIGILTGYWLRSNSARTEAAQLDRRGAELATERDALRSDLAARAELDKKIAAELSRLQTELTLERGNAEKLTNQFKVLAAEILKENSTAFAAQNRESLTQLLNPLTKDLTDFKAKVEKATEENLVGRTQLASHLEGLKTMHQRLTEEAHNLSTALRRDTKTQGNWGELILLDLLENQGLKKDIHYTFQQSFVATEDDATRRRQTDVIVKLPENRHLIIDSKVSLNAYNDAVSATTDDLRRAAIKRHLVSIKGHITELASRNYQRLPGIDSPDFVVMFVPIEPAFLMAMQEEDGLWLEAYEKGILLTGPTTLLFVIRIVESLWRQEQQAKNVREVMDRGAALYDKFVGFAHNLADVGVKIDAARTAYDDATKQLSSGPGNLVRQVELLKDLGIRPTTKKKMPQKLLDNADVDNGQLNLAAESDE
jgi:DNA recombination protein RmuC